MGGLLLLLLTGVIIFVVNSVAGGGKDGASSSESSLEERILEEQTNFHITQIGMSAAQAKKMAKEMLEGVVKECKNDKSYYVYKNLGSAVLDDLPIEDEYSQFVAATLRGLLQQKRDAGVTDEDIRWWLDMHEVERRMMGRNSDIAQIALFTELSEIGIDDKSAMHEVRKYHPQYGHKEDNEFMKGEDRPLPPELRDRINKYILRRVSLDYRQYEEDIKKSSSFNALVRKEIKSKNL